MVVRKVVKQQTNRTWLAAPPSNDLTVDVLEWIGLRDYDEFSTVATEGGARVVLGVVKGGVRVSGCGSVVVRKVVNATNRTWLGAPPSNRSNRGRLEWIGLEDKKKGEAAAVEAAAGGEREGGGGYLRGGG